MNDRYNHGHVPYGVEVVSLTAQAMERRWRIA